MVATVFGFMLRCQTVNMVPTDLRNPKPGTPFPKQADDRNKGMVDKTDILFAVWDGIQKGGTWNAVKYAKETGKQVFRLDLDKLGLPK